jgi:hypothetical protein
MFVKAFTLAFNAKFITVLFKNKHIPEAENEQVVPLRFNRRVDGNTNRMNEPEMSLLTV